MGGPTESRAGEGSRLKLAVPPLVQVSTFSGLDWPSLTHTFLIFFYRDLNHTDHHQNSSQGKNNVTATLLLKCRQVVRCENRGSCSLPEKLMIFLKYIMNPLNLRTTDEASDLK